MAAGLKPHRHIGQASDAILTVEGSIQGLNLKEFFLLLSSTGLGSIAGANLSAPNGTEIVMFSLGKAKEEERKLGAPNQEAAADT